MTKQAMVHCYEAGYLPLLQVHDELVFSIKSDEDVENICRLMEEAVLQMFQTRWMPRLRHHDSMEPKNN